MVLVSDEVGSRQSGQVSKPKRAHVRRRPSCHGPEIRALQSVARYRSASPRWSVRQRLSAQPPERPLRDLLYLLVRAPQAALIRKRRKSLGHRTITAKPLISSRRITTILTSRAPCLEFTWDRLSCGERFLKITRKQMRMEEPRSLQLLEAVARTLSVAYSNDGTRIYPKRIERTRGNCLSVSEGGLLKRPISANVWQFPVEVSQPLLPQADQHLAMRSSLSR